jgi:ribulose-phosphate 3-epimerase
MLEDVIQYADLVLVMTVNPGFSGQKMIEGCLNKIEQLAKIRKERGLNFQTSADGGINAENGQKVVSAGADVLVMGSSFFSSTDKKGLVAKFS